VPVPAFDPSAGAPAYLYAKVADHVAARIAAGDLRPGDRLPAEREFAAEYEVSLGTGRRAVAELRARGLVITLPTLGTFVTER
jgi:GntR family transcriptional regulator